MKRKGIVLIVIVFMALVFQYANSDVCRAAGKKTAYGTVSENGEVLYIPKTVKTAYGLNMHCGGIYYKSLKKVVVSKENKYYKSVNGVLYNKKGTELVHYPAKKSGSTYKIPSSVKYVDCVAFIGNKNIKKIILGKNVKHFDDGALNYMTIGEGCTELEKIIVSKENKYYKSVNGVLYNKKGTKLVVYPAKKSGSTYKLPSTVNYIGCWAFMGNESLKNITIDENVTKIDEGAFKGTKIEHIELSGGKADAGKKLKLMMDAFAQCSNLKEITGGYRVSETGWLTFELCKILQNMDIGKGLEKLDYSFGGCVSLNKICLSDKLKDINGDAFVDGGCKEFYVEDTNKKYKSIDGCLYEITDSAKGSLKLLFSANTSDFKYVTPDNVVEVSDSAFKGRDAVKEISIGGGVTEFECDSIQNCSGLEILRLSSRVKKVVRFRWDYGCYVSDNNLSNLKKIEVDAGNAKYESYNNELFTKGRKRAILLPYGSKNIIIPKETEEFYGGITLNKFEKIEVEKGNKYFTVKDNVVYDKDVTNIMVFPTYKTTYTLPATLKEFPAMTFRYVEDYLDWAGTAEITKADMNLSCVKVAKGNKYFKAVDGVLYAKKTGQLEYYPPAKKGSYKILKGTKTVNDSAFVYTRYLTELTVPSSVKSIVISPRDSASLKKVKVSKKCKVTKMTKREGAGVKIVRVG